MTTLYSQRHYEDMAAEVRNHARTVTDAAHLCVFLMRNFQRDNTRFKPDKFVKACVPNWCTDYQIEKFKRLIELSII